MLERPRRQAAIVAMENVRNVLEWESLPETSAKFQTVAADFDRQFEEECKRKDKNDDEIYNLNESHDDDTVSDASHDDEMDEDDKNFIDNADDDYVDSDATFVLSEDDVVSTSSEENDHNVANLTELDELAPDTELTVSQVSDVVDFDDFFVTDEQVL